MHGTPGQRRHSPVTKKKLKVLVGPKRVRQFVDEYFNSTDDKYPVEQLRNFDEVSNRAIVTLDKAEVSNEYNF